jgi:hypothetical protein
LARQHVPSRSPRALRHDVQRRSSSRDPGGDQTKRPQGGQGLGMNRSPCIRSVRD